MAPCRNPGRGRIPWRRLRPVRGRRSARGRFAGRRRRPGARRTGCRRPFLHRRNSSAFVLGAHSSLLSTERFRIPARMRRTAVRAEGTCLYPRSSVWHDPHARRYPDQRHGPSVYVSAASFSYGASEGRKQRQQCDRHPLCRTNRAHPRAGSGHFRGHLGACPPTRPLTPATGSRGPGLSGPPAAVQSPRPPAAAADTPQRFTPAARPPRNASRHAARAPGTAGHGPRPGLRHTAVPAVDTGGRTGAPRAERHPPPERHPAAR
jgi:hypothetical protein